MPVLEQTSGLKAGSDFTVGYSPERINPGDKEHRFETIIKVVSGQDARTLDIVADVYGSVVTAGIHRAPSIKVAEAAKVIENTQRDLNIAFMNELSAICHQLGIDTGDVLAAAHTKWNFLKFYAGPGRRPLHRRRSVLSDVSRREGRLSSGGDPGRPPHQRRRRPAHRARMRPLPVHAAARAAAIVTVLGLTFKENVPDTRNSKVVDIVRELQASGVTVQVHDPLAHPRRGARTNTASR